jgi:beta-glucosidase
MNGGDSLSVQCTITNTGLREGKEIIQLYLQDVECTVPRPVKELKGFRKISLSPGESQEVTFTIKEEDLMFFDETSNQWVAEPGDFKILIGASSSDIRLEAIFQYTKF